MNRACGIFEAGIDRLREGSYSMLDPEPSIPRLNDRGFLNHHVVHRHILVKSALTGFDLADFVNDFGAGGDFAEHAVAPALRRGRAVVQEIVVLGVDKKLRARRMWIGSAR